MAQRMMPEGRPEVDRASVLAWLPQVPEEKVFLVGRRGHFEMGDPGNDRGIYDDAIFLISPTAFIGFNANTDPSVWRFRSNEQVGMAVLQPGRYMYVVGTHNITKPKDRQYEALVQASGVNLLRDGHEKVEYGVWKGINIHRGSRFNTSSLGCQTVHPDQWDIFLGLVKSEMSRHEQKHIPYILTARD